MAKKAVRQSTVDEVREAVATFVAAGAEESVQRVITAVHRVSRRLNQWYDQQLVDLDVSSGEWAVLSALARAGSEGAIPSQLAAAAHVAPSSMTHRLDRMEAEISRHPRGGSGQPDAHPRPADRGGLAALHVGDPGVQHGGGRSDRRSHRAAGERARCPAGEDAGRSGLRGSLKQARRNRPTNRRGVVSPRPPTADQIYSACI